jgi:hypothetical protein
VQITVTEKDAALNQEASATSPDKVVSQVMMDLSNSHVKT